MSSALAIAGVSAVLQYYLSQPATRPARRFGGTFSSPRRRRTSCRKHHRRRRQNQVNVFLHQVTHNVAWRNSGSAVASARTA